jgi:hypothetical protein
VAKAEVCKTSIHRFDSGRRLQPHPPAHQAVALRPGVLPSHPEGLRLTHRLTRTRARSIGTIFGATAFVLSWKADNFAAPSRSIASSVIAYRR